MNRRLGGEDRKRSKKLFGSLLRPKATPDSLAQAAAPEPEDRGMGPGYVLGLSLLIVVVAAAFIYHLGVRFEGVRLGYETSKARALQTRLLLERRELRLELASLKSPGRVEEDARDKLGMEIPDHDRIVPIGKKRKVVSVSGGAL